MSNNLNKLNRDKDFNPSDFSKKIKESKVDSFNLDYLHIDKNKPLYTQDLKDINIKKNISNLSLSEIILEMNEIFFISLELLSKGKNPLIFIFSSSKRQFCASLLLLILGFLLLILSNLMMESK